MTQNQGRQESGEIMREIPKANQIYRHYKGDLYRIVTPAIHSETGERMVVYQALYGDYTVYVTELSQFMGKVDKRKYTERRQKEIFALVTELVGQETEPLHVRTNPDEPIRIRTGSEELADNTPEARGSGAAVPGAREEKGTDGLQNKEKTAPEEDLHRENTDAGKTAGAAQGDAETAQTDGEAALDPFLVRFLDADTHKEKLNLLAALQARITDDMVNTMAVSLDVEIPDGEIEDRYEALKNCLLTLEKYECNRLR